MELLTLIAAALSFAVLNADIQSQFPPPLDKERERQLFLLSAEGDREARGKLIEHNLRLVAHIVRKYYSQGENSEDLISVGTVGLIKAVDSFDVKNGARFATYGAKCIQNEILMFFRSRKKTQNEVSINETIDTDRDGNPLTYMDIIRCEDTIADDIYNKTRLEKALSCIYNILDAREREIIVLRYGIGDSRALTQRETAEKLGISRSYVSRIEKNALSKVYDNIK